VLKGYLENGTIGVGPSIRHAQATGPSVSKDKIFVCEDPFVERALGAIPLLIEEISPLK